MTAYDPATGDMVLFGGSTHDGDDDLGDTWTFKARPGRSSRRPLALPPASEQLGLNAATSASASDDVLHHAFARLEEDVEYDSEITEAMTREAQ